MKWGLLQKDGFWGILPTAPNTSANAKAREIVTMVFNKNFCSGFPVLDRTSWSLEDVCTIMRIFQYKVGCTKSTSPSLISFPNILEKGLEKILLLDSKQVTHQFQPAQENNNNSFVKEVYGLFPSEILLMKEIEQVRKVISCPWLWYFAAVAPVTVKCAACDECTALLREVGWKYLSILHGQMEYMAIFKTGTNGWI